MTHRCATALVAACCWILASCAGQPSRIPIDQVPMYGGMDRQADPVLKQADETFIAGVASTAGSRQNGSRVFTNIGFDLYGKDDLDGAMRRFNQAWLLDPENPEVYWGFASVLSDRGRPCDARRMVDMAFAKGPIQPGFLPDAGRIYAACATAGVYVDADTRTRYLARSEELFVQAMAAPGVKKDYALQLWIVSLVGSGRYDEAMVKVAEYRKLTGSDPDPRLMQELRRHRPDFK